MLKILHTADWHLGQTFFGYDRENEHQHFLNWLLDEILNREIDVLLISGDVFDVSNPSASAQHLYYKFIHQLTVSCPQLQVVVTAGNHDSAARLEAPSPLLETMNVHVRGTIAKKDGVIDYNKLMIELNSKKHEAKALCLAAPFLRQGDYPVVDSTGNTYSLGVKEFYRQLIAEAKSKQPNLPLIVMGHFQATGSEIAEKDHSERTIIGGLEAVSPDVFDQDIAYVALGHIHKAQRVSGREFVRYAGSPLSFSFAEKHYKHGVVMIEIDEESNLAIEKLNYTPLVALQTIPAHGIASPAEALSLLEELPNVSSSDDNDAAYPYLEIKVRFAEPEPLFVNQVNEVLKSKAVRLARIVSTYNQQDVVEDEDTQDESEDLHQMNPADIMRTTFEKRYGEQPSDELQALFAEVFLTINQNHE